MSKPSRHPAGHAAGLCAGALALLLAGCGGSATSPGEGNVTGGGEPSVSGGAATLRAQPDTAPTAADMQGPASASASAPMTELAQLRLQVAELQHEVTLIRRQLARLPTATQADASAVQTPRGAEARAEAEQTERLRIASTESAFRNETIDPRWSQGSTAAVRAALSMFSESVSPHVRSVECRSQSCRVELNAEGGLELNRDLPLLIGQLGPTLPNVTAGQIDQGNGRQATVLYFSSQATALASGDERSH